VVPTLLRLPKRVVAGTARLQRINIGPRLSLCFLLIIVAMLAGNAVLLWQFQQSQRQAERLTGVDQELIAVLQAHTSLMSFYEKLDVLAHSEDTALLQTQIETLHQALLEESLRTRNTLSHLPPEVQLDPTLLPTLLAIQGELPAQLETIASLAKSGAWDPVRLRLANQVRPLESRSSALVENVDRVVGEERAQAILNMRQAQRRIFLIVPFTAVITLVFATFLGWVITRSITQPLGRLVEGSTALAKGDFCHRVPATGHDEIARLGSVFNDMTMRLQEVYRHLQASETYLAEAQKLSQTGSFGWDSASGKIYWSAETFRIFELAPTTKVAVDAILERTHPEDRSTLQEVMERVARDRTTLDVEHRLLMPNGSVKHLRVVGHLFTSDGEFLGAITDITEQKRAQQALAASERNLSLMINAIPTSIHVLRADGSVLYVNQAVLDYTGLTLEDVKKESYRSRVFHPEDVKRLRDERRVALTRPVPFETEQRVLGKDGEYRWFLVRYNPLLDEQGRIDRWYVAAFDIEDRKRAELELKQAYLHFSEAQRLSKTGSFISDLLVDEHIWSEELRRICEFDPKATITVQMVRDIIHPEDVPLYEAAVARAMDGKDVDFLFRIVTSRGVVKHLRGIARVTELIAGRPLFSGAIQDVTEIKVAEEALNLARSELAHVARVTTLNALTASIAHEVNQPLSGIITNASTCLRMLNGDPPNADGARETARRIIRDGNRTSDVISRLRALFSKKEFTLEPLDFNEAAREVMAMSLSDLQRDRVILRSELSEDLPPVTGDRVQLQQVILNLLRNASDAMNTIEDRPRELLVTTDRDEEDRVRLSVKDVGVGFRPEVGEKLFEAFYTTKKDGMGIGLSISRSIIEAHRGHLWAQPNDGPGTTFSFSIPCRSGLDADCRTATKPVDSAADTD
jgi:PAS domain S-box-containing protein